jgi:urea transport system permease protein
LFMLGGLFVAVTLLLPRGIVGTVQHWMSQRRKHILAAEDTAANGTAPDRRAANGITAEQTANNVSRPAA